VLRTTRLDSVTRFDLARTLLGRGRYWTTCYLVDSTMVDTGCAHAAAELLEQIAGTRVTRIVNTHTHEDHIGVNGALQQAYPGLEVVAHPEALPVLADPRGEQPLHPYRRVMWGWPSPCRARALTDGEVLETERHRFRVIFTPGHSWDHLCLYEPDCGWLLTGDLYVGGRDRALREGADVWRIITSLRRMKELGAEILLPGSARVRHDPEVALQDKIDHLEELGGKVLDLHGRGWPIRRITRRVCGAPMKIEAITLGHFSRRHLVRSYLGAYSDPTRRGRNQRA